MKSYDLENNLQIQIEQISGDLYIQKNKASPLKHQKLMQKRKDLSTLYNSQYKPAIYQVALNYRNQRSYRKKRDLEMLDFPIKSSQSIQSAEQQPQYVQLGLFQNTQQYKKFGLGPYFCIQFMRRIVWLFFILSLLVILMLVINIMGTGLSSYSFSFSTFLITTTLGNYSIGSLASYDGYFLCLIPSIVYLTIFVWFLFWKYHYLTEISEQQNDEQRIKPEKFCVEVSGLHEDLIQEEYLQAAVANFGPIYEISPVLRHKNQLTYFQELETLDSQINQKQLEIGLEIQKSGIDQSLQQLKNKRSQLKKYIDSLQIKPIIVSAYVHFQYQKSKSDMLQFYNNHYLFQNNPGHILMRNLCCCILQSPQQKYLIQTGDVQLDKPLKLFIKSQKVPQPQDINWESKQISPFSKFFRILFAFVVILIFLILSCAIIGICSVYISGNSINCDDITIPSSVSQAQTQSQTNSQVKTCFCNANLFTAFSNELVINFCGQLFAKLYIQQGIQFAVVAGVGITNFLFGKAVHYIVNFARTESYSRGLLIKTIIFTSFMIFNTMLLPLIIYAQIFGFKSVQYFSFLTLIISDLGQILNISGISFHEDFSRVWYRNVSSVFTNYVIIDTAFTWLFFVYYKIISRREYLKNEQGRMLQKTMNEKITSFQYNLYVQNSYFYLILTMSVFYSAGIPVLIPLGFINLFSKYLTTRSVLQNNSAKIEGLSQQYNSFTLFLIPILLIFTCLFGGWMLAANQDIYPNGVQLGFLPSYFDSQVLKQGLFLPYYLGIAAVIAFYLLFYNILIRFFKWLRSLCYRRMNLHQRSTVVPLDQTSIEVSSQNLDKIKQKKAFNQKRKFSQLQRKLSILGSYNIRNNDKLRRAIINLEKHMIGTTVKKN